MIHAEAIPGIVPLPADRMIRWRSQMAIEEGVPAVVEHGGEETPPSGVGWSWCT